MEAFLQVSLPRWLPPACEFEIHSFQGKLDLLANLQARLRGYASWIPQDWRIVVVVDRDDEDCRPLKRRLEEAAGTAGMRSKTVVGGRGAWQVVNRIAVEELEAWFFGDWSAVRAAYPKVSPTVPAQAAYRRPDAVAGGTWEALERLLQRHGYHKGGLPKMQVARQIAAHLDPTRSTSPSFTAFYEAVCEAVS